ncbi:MAG TPA: beta-ketoacyl-ACP synthase III [Streptosporangiaceae bacterium]
MIPTAVLAGLGSYLPPRVVTNAEIAARVGSSEEWIRTRTGIERRHIAACDTATSDLAVAAGRRALACADATSADVVLVATTTPDQPCPATAPSVASRLGLAGAGAFDIGAVCSGFIYALAAGTGLIAAGTARSVLVIAAEIYSSIMDPADRTTSVIFGDGAGAVLLRAGAAAEPGAIGPFDLHSDGGGRDLIAVPAGGTRGRTAAGPAPARRYFEMDGKQVFWRAVQEMAGSSRAVLEAAGRSPADVDWLVCHQANARITAQLARELGIGAERCVTNIDQVGNTAGASIPIALDHACRDGTLAPGDRLLLTAFGGGLTWGSTLLTWPGLGPRHRKAEHEEDRWQPPTTV